MQEVKMTINGLTIGADWISFTILNDWIETDVIEFLGLQPENFRKMPRGANGYKRMLKFEDISILFDGGDNMGIHVNISGGSIATVIEAFQKSRCIENPFGQSGELCCDLTFSLFCEEVLKIGHFTRIDLAIDDIGQHYYSLEELLEKRASGKIISKWRNCQSNEERVVSTNEKTGHTLYFGSKQSEIQMRVYDKKLERNKGLSKDDENYVHNDWIRWELQLRDERADEVAKLISSHMFIGEVAIGVLSNYIRIINLDDSNKSRCSSEEKWEQFVYSISKLRIVVRKTPKRLDEEIKQFEMQQGRKVSKMLYANGGDVDYFLNLAQRYECKLTP